MSLVHDYHEERKARLARLGARECPGCAELRKEAVDRSIAATASAKIAAAQVITLAAQSAEIVECKGRIAALECAIKNSAASAALADMVASIESDASIKAHDDAKRSAPTVLNIVKATCEHFSRSYADIVSPRRDMASVWPRQIAMYLAKTLTQQSLPEIGRRMGDRDHTTVLHAVRKIKALVEQGHPLAMDVAAIRSKFGAP